MIMENKQPHPQVLKYGSLMGEMHGLPIHHYHIVYDSLSETRFRQVWRLICRTYKKAPHCFLRGCGKETLLYWVVGFAGSHGQSLNKRELRKALEEAERRKWLICNRRHHKCTQYKIHC